jgi:hypothetical protein
MEHQGVGNVVVGVHVVIPRRGIVGEESGAAVVAALGAMEPGAGR